jgi:hypothetical protein
MNSDNMITKYERYREQLKQDLRRRIDSAKDYAELFEIVKRVVEIHTGRHRAGLSLILQDMPTALGAYYPVGTNTIVLNRALVAGMRAVSKNDREVNYFVFMVLMHEYLHSLGYLSEASVRNLCERICSAVLGADHPSVKLAKTNWLEIHPELQMVGKSRVSDDYEVVDRFDVSSTSYIG